jgi:hypothetical protein
MQDQSSMLIRLLANDLDLVAVHQEKIGIDTERAAHA